MIRTLAAALSASICLVGYATPAAAQTREYRIPAGSLKSALDAYARQSGRQVIYKADDVLSARSPGARGALSADAALQALLAGSGFTVRTDSSGAVAIVKAGNVSAAAEEGDAEHGDIVVTASRRAEKLKDVPSSVSAIGADRLANLNASRFDDFISQIPNISFTGRGPGARQIILRGVSTSTNEQSATVATYVDDIAVGSSTALAVGSRIKPDINVFDLDRIEVLRGPQGTLYGANSLGGLLKYVTKAPSTDRVEAAARLEATTVAHGGEGYAIDAGVNVPLGDAIAVRMSGFHRKESGYIDNLGIGEKDVNDLTSSGGRIAVLAKPSDQLTLRATAMYQRFRTGGQSTADIDLATGENLFGKYEHRHFGPEPMKQAFQLYSLSADYAFGGATLTSSSSYSIIDESTRTDFTQFDGGSIPGVILYPDLGTSSTRKFTQELRLASEANGQFEWLLGAYYTREKSRLTDLEVGLIDEQGTVGTGDANPVFFSDALSRFRQYAGYGDATIYLADSFDITGGVRYTHNETRLESIGDGFFNGGYSELTTTAKDDAWTFLVTPRWRVSNATLIYARAAKGFRPGGPNILGPADVAAGTPLSFVSDSLWNYEAGIKTSALDQAVSLDLSLFYIDWSKIQIRSTVGGFAFIGNGGKATSKGGELTLELRPTRGFLASVNLGYTDAKLAEDAIDIGGLDGMTLPNAPKWTIGGAVNYDFALSDKVGASLGGSWRVVSDRQADFNRDFSPRLQLDGYGTLDLRAGLRFENFDLDIFAKNVTDTRGLEATNLTFAPATVTVSRPRVLGMSLTARY